MKKSELHKIIADTVYSYMYDDTLKASYKTYSIDQLVKAIENKVYDIDSKYLGRFYYSFHEFKPAKMQLEIYYTFTEDIDDLREEMDIDKIKEDTIALFRKRNRDINNDMKKVVKYIKTYADIDNKYGSDLIVSTFLIDTNYCVYDRRRKEIIAFSNEKEKNRNDYLFED